MRAFMSVTIGICSVVLMCAALQAAADRKADHILPVNSQATPAPLSVAIHDNYFEPISLRVSPGTTVRWVNRGKTLHTVTSPNKLFDSGELRPGESHDVTFAHPGVYGYYCRFHPTGKMLGTVIVGYTSSRSEIQR